MPLALNRRRARRSVDIAQPFLLLRQISACAVVFAPRRKRASVSLDSTSAARRAGVFVDPPRVP
ncbi:hypothetical protein [uncultured Cloacibacillus sp.]|uniref:hypothetical protein n=1 Tax=uncultured Cloacibacillus sp. TaxID=889794 RepID=UPI0025EA5D8A|nr:hypothetical protein [uncultured Cloacibacillus sp.]